MTKVKINKQELYFLQSILTEKELHLCQNFLFINNNKNLFINFINKTINNSRKKELILNELHNDILQINTQQILDRMDITQLIKKPFIHPNLLCLEFNGNPKILNFPKIAIIGSRHPTYYGRKQAYYFARELAQKNCVILSGGAIGIDTIATATALEFGNACCVLGSGLENIYPTSNRELFEKLKKNPHGLLLSEFNSNCNAQKWNFPRRNLTIAALVDFVLVIEGKSTSGSLITANFANDLGIDVGALPGCVDNPNSCGTNELIANGAFCIQTPSDVLERVRSCSHYFKESSICDQKL